MGDVRLDCIYLKLLLLLSKLYFIFIHHELASLCLGCLFAFLIAHNSAGFSLIDCGVRYYSPAGRLETIEH